MNLESIETPVEKTTKIFEELAKTKPEAVEKIALTISYRQVNANIKDTNREDVKNDARLAKGAIVALNELKKMQDEGTVDQYFKDAEKSINISQRYTGGGLMNIIDYTSKEEIEKAIKRSQSYIDRADKSKMLIAMSKRMAEAYHKAKTEDSNPELVKAVEDLISQKEING